MKTIKEYEAIINDMECNDKQDKFAVMDSDTKEPVSDFIASYDEAAEMVDDYNRICKDTGGSSTQYGIIRESEYYE